jgi:striatin 1/3/4
VGHTDSVATVAVDPTGMLLVSGGHDGSIRLWDVRTYQCLQEMPAHRKKYDEGVFCVKYSPDGRLLSSGGADSLVKIILPIN